MPNISEKGAIHLLIPLLLIGGIIATVWLITAGPLNLFPKASVSGPTGPTTSFTLAAQKSDYRVGELVEVKVLVRSDVAATNLFAAKINYDQSALQLGRVDVTSFVTNWVEQYWGDLGKISLTGGVPAPGLLTQANSAPSKMATLYFTALKAGTTNITFADDSAIYDNANNLNILSSKVNSTVSITTGGVSNPVPTTTPRPTVSPTPSATPRPSATPVPGTGDGNNNGKADLGDMSVLLTDFNKTTGFRKPIDMNGDGKINTFDFALMRNFLIQKGVIKG